MRRLYDSLIAFVAEIRDGFDNFEVAGKKKCSAEYRNTNKGL